MIQILVIFTFLLCQAVATHCGDPNIGPVLMGVDFVQYVTNFLKTGNATLPVRGLKEYVVKLDKYQFLFQSSANADIFRSNPEAYYPQYGGYCAWGLTGYDTHVKDPSG